ncbi:hypothetical protein E0Z10_g2138 [Xylaria hypoxylon]|uniref:Uncharacterized protein n=1 Tax=Xylaria hypoxylon TaxID=37992 RepID=A0A4Z0Z5B4_9PEZI|nr:hypothetical protein E0Z10_g2138 [Xylaria hypoxylon]
MSYSESETFELALPGHSTRKPSALGPENQFLTAKCLRFVYLRTSHFSFVFLHPIAEKLVLQRCTWDMLAGMVRDLRQEKVRIIHLAESYVAYWGFEDIMTAFPNLRELVYYRPCDEEFSQYHEVGDVFRKFGQGLESLKFFNDALMPFETPLGSLQSLVSLKTLEIPLEMLIGFRPNPREGYYEYLDAAFDPDEVLDYDEEHEAWGDWSFLELLPTSLEKLTIDLESPKTDVYFNTYERYGVKFEELLIADRRFDKLEYVRAPYIDVVAAKLRGRLTGWVLADRDTIKRVPRTVPTPDAVPLVVDVSDESTTDCGEGA